LADPASAATVWQRDADLFRRFPGLHATLARSPVLALEVPLDWGSRDVPRRFDLFDVFGALCNLPTDITDQISRDGRERVAAWKVLEPPNGLRWIRERRVVPDAEMLRAGAGALSTLADLTDERVGKAIDEVLQYNLGDPGDLDAAQLASLERDLKQLEDFQSRRSKREVMRYQEFRVALALVEKAERIGSGAEIVQPAPASRRA